ncbi:class I poly(R)-hydroxyalkanoic acid synthase [uncultured Paracoccus sp.]|uniref:class I poly(R)-hydroxyalkanoic acid synthase n=1 Tax=uncultured Paracoccus sp. TaxID=189685 RepID=UPI0025FA6AC0|nr:class I poly(R)-hydroxyalkanoic acid synthase [uncultured Paracoccus sp.]
MAEALARGSSGATARKLAENIERIEALGQRLMSALTARSQPNPGIEAPGPDLFLTAANAWVKTLSEQPTLILENQVNYWGETLKNYASVHRALTQGKAQPDPEGNPSDKRFANPLWDRHPYFSFVKRQYLINAKALRDAAGNLQLADDTARRRITWLTDQIVDMMAPTNFLATNPDALERAVETEGESLVKGLENLVRDVERNSGDIVVSLADRDAFSIGDNIGTSDGVVVHRTPLYELIQYKPVTDQVFETPLLIFPPWINKFYILDLKPQNSLIKWLTEQGHTLFIVSWKNPDHSYAEVGMEDYVAAYLDAMDKVRDLTDQPRLNVVGYCIAGTTLSLTLALLKQRNDDRVASATLFTTLTDFSDQGEFVSFLQDDFVNGIADEVKRHGILPARLMSRTMSFLRPNDLVWGPAIRSYMMGEAPPAFDLLFWNGDSTNLPGKMTMQYLRGLCQQNAFATTGFDLMGHKLHLSDVTTPLCAIACETDHIAPWKDCWRGFAAMGSSDKTFILSESGHIAGIVNPPTKKKYGHYLGGSDFDGSYRDWKESASFTPGSWWTRWSEWLSERAGRMVPAREPDGGLGPAPGTYVHERAA